MNNNIFITYNPNSEAEQNTALRLQTISNLYGLAVSLPYRQANLVSISNETKNRIKNSTFIVAFCLQELSPQLTEELNFAISLKKPTVVIFDNNLGKTIHFTGYENIKECFVDFN